MTFRKDPKPTVGAELELHSVLVATLKEGASKNDPRTYIVSEEPYPLFTLSGVTCVLDNSSGAAITAKDAKLTILDNKGVTETVVDFSKKDKMGGEIFEFQTNKSDSPEEVSQAFSRIKKIEKHLQTYFEKNAHYSLISLKTWIDDFNRDYKTEPDMQIIPTEASKDIYLATQSSLKAIKKIVTDEKSSDLKYAPQFNFSVAIDMLSESRLENILTREIEESLEKIVNARIKEFLIKKEAQEKAIIQELKNAEPDQELIAKRQNWIEFYNNKIIELKENYNKKFTTQCAILKSARETANQTNLTLSTLLTQANKKDEKSTPKLRKLSGLFFILNYYVRTETANLALGVASINKNKYLFFIKHKMSDIVNNCLSARDKQVIADLKANPDAQNQILTMLAGSREALNTVMYSYNSNPNDPDAKPKEVTVADFLKSSLGWSNDRICDKLPTAGKFQPPQEPEGHRSKNHLLSRLVIELRWPGEDISLQESEKLMLQTMQMASPLNETTFLKKSYSNHFFSPVEAASPDTPAQTADERTEVKKLP